MGLEARGCVVTGGGRGIGAAVARSFAREGARLVIAARSRTELDAVAEELRAGGADVAVVAADVADPATAPHIVDTALRAYGRLDVVVNAAGTYGPIGPTWEVDAALWERALRVNLLGYLYLCRAAIPHMISARRGSIVGFSGGGATAPLARFSAYAASKAAVVRLTETLADELEGTDVRVNVISPGAVDTRLQDEVLAAGSRAGDLFDRIRTLRDTGEGSVPAELAAELAVFLASDQSEGLTGKLIAAPHDAWRSWDRTDIDRVMRLPWFTLRRLDPFTIRPFIESGGNGP